MLATSPNQVSQQGRIPLPDILFCLFIQRKCQNIARISSILLVYWKYGWAIPQDNRMQHRIWHD